MTATAEFQLQTAVDPLNILELTNVLVSSFQNKASENKSFFVNEISAQLYLDTNPQMFSCVFRGLLSVITCAARDSCIRLTSKTYGKMILLQVKDSNSLNPGCISGELQKLHSIAERMKGSVEVTSQRRNLTTITFGFPNLSCAN